MAKNTSKQKFFLVFFTKKGVTKSAKVTFLFIERWEGNSQLENRGDQGQANGLFWMWLTIINGKRNLAFNSLSVYVEYFFGSLSD